MNIMIKFLLFLSLFGYNIQLLATEHHCWEFIENKAFNQLSEIVQKVDLSINEELIFSDINYKHYSIGELSGIKILSSFPSKGFLVIAQGNASSIKLITSKLSPLAELGIDIFAFNYRGYQADGTESSTGAIFSDYKTILNHISNLPEYSNKLAFAYGISWGGVVLLNATNQTNLLNLLIIDSTPDSLPWFAFCDSKIYPKNLTKSRDNIAYIAGKLDYKVRPSNMSEMKMHAEINNNIFIIGDSLAHPFEDNDDLAQRLKIIKGLLSAFVNN